MGPWPGDHGNGQKQGGQRRGRILLQWGRGLVTTEICQALKTGDSASCFNGAVAW